MAAIQRKDIVYEKMSFQLSDKMPFVVDEHAYSSTESAPSFDIHYELEAGIILEGEMLRHSKGRTSRLSRGDVWTYGMWDPHGVRIAKAPCRVITVVIWPPFLSDMVFPESPGLSLMRLFSGQGNIFLMDEGRKRRTVSLARELLLSNRRRLASDALRRRLLLMQLMLLLVETRPSLRSAPEMRLFSTTSHALVNPALNIVFSSKKPISNVEAARACSMSRDKFIRLFRGVMGMSFAKFARRYRLSCAANMLLSTDSPVKKVAETWGFTDQSHLHAMFLEHYSCTPGEYRTRPKIRSKW